MSPACGSSGRRSTRTCPPKQQNAVMEQLVQSTTPSMPPRERTSMQPSLRLRDRPRAADQRAGHRRERHAVHRDRRTSSGSRERLLAGETSQRRGSPRPARRSATATYSVSSSSAGWRAAPASPKGGNSHGHHRHVRPRLATSLPLTASPISPDDRDYGFDEIGDGSPAGSLMHSSRSISPRRPRARSWPGTTRPHGPACSGCGARSGLDAGQSAQQRRGKHRHARELRLRGPVLPGRLRAA